MFELNLSFILETDYKSDFRSHTVNGNKILIDQTHIEF